MPHLGGHQGHVVAARRRPPRPGRPAGAPRQVRCRPAASGRTPAARRCGWAAGRTASAGRAPAPSRARLALAEWRSAAALSSAPFGSPVDPEVAITTAVPGASAGRRPPAASRSVPVSVSRESGPSARSSAATLSGGSRGSTGSIAGPLPSSAALSSSSSRPACATAGSRTACRGRWLIDVRLSGRSRRALGGQSLSEVAAQVDAALGGLRAFAIPMRTRFRGITVREGALIEGPAAGPSSPRSRSTGRGSARAGWPARWRRPGTAGPRRAAIRCRST